MSHSLLLVDDEQSVLDGLRRVFRRQGYNVMTTTSAAEALRTVAGNSIGVLVSDYRMPRMTGVELLEKVRICSPDTVRILLTGQADFDSVVEAINRGAVYKFLVKPCDPDDLRSCVRGAFEHHDLIEKNRKLTAELHQVNEELRDLNANLEIRVEHKAGELTRALYFDPVTGLANRTLMADRLNQAVLHAQRADTIVALILFDIDRFKRINESLGLSAGDGLLHAVADRISEQVRGADALGRISGDEFAAVVDDIASARDAERVAKRILSALGTPFAMAGHDVFITASMGISMFPDDGDNADDLYRNAATALHQAKKDGRHHCRFYAEHLNTHSRRRLSLEAELRRALEREEFFLHYQPRVDAESGRIVGAEALLRLQRAAGDALGPAEFVPVLEDTGLIEPVGAWVLAQACAAAARWPADGVPPVRVSVNISPRQFRNAELVEVVASTLSDSGLHAAGRCLELEITESLLVNEESRVQQMLEALHAMGVVLAMDDFGTGYSSLSYLTRFPISILKIDQSFVRGIGHDRDSESLVKAIIAMARALRLQAVAEGVETLEQRETLKQHGCDEFQGYLFSPPVSEEALVGLLTEGGILPVTGNPDYRHGSAGGLGVHDREVAASCTFRRAGAL